MTTDSSELYVQEQILEEHLDGLQTRLMEWWTADSGNVVELVLTAVMTQATSLSHFT